MVDSPFRLFVKMKTHSNAWWAMLTVAAAAIAVFASPTQPARAAGPWYVATTGDDGNDCLTSGTACASINGVLAKPGFVAGDSVNIGTGTYTGTGSEVVLLDKNVALSGGWDGTFTTQDGYSTIDGEGARRGMTISSGVTATADRINFQNGSSTDGGGIYNSGTLALTSCLVTANDATDGVWADGAGIFNASSGDLTLSNCSVDGNSSEGSGGGIYNYGNLSLSNSTVHRNSSSGTGGISNQGTATLIDSSVSENIGVDPGGITNEDTLILIRSAVNRNSGRGIYNRDTLILVNSTISGNVASGQGGGIYNYFGSVTIYTSTISDNSGSTGGGISSWSGPVTTQNSIIAGNHAGSGPDCATGTITSAGYNLIGDTSGCTFNSSSGDLTDVDPNIGWLIGSPGYHPLLAGSAAIEAGNPSGCTDHLGDPIASDQRGVARSGICDIGAYEYTVPGSAASAYIYDGTPQRTPLHSTFPTLLQLAVLDDVGSPVSGVTTTFDAPSSGASGTFADSGTNSTASDTSDFGIATAASLTANAVEGSYTVSATVSGIGTLLEFQLTNAGWYVSLSGDDADDCQSPATACEGVNGALAKGGFVPGDTVLVESGTYTGTGNEVVLLDGDVRILGGWNDVFTGQSGSSIIDGEAARRGMKVNSGVIAIVESAIVQNGFAYNGSGIYNEGSLTLTDSIVRNNSTSESQGGGIYTKGDLNLIRSTVSGNGASGGGGIYIYGGFTTLNRSSVNGNYLFSGGSGGGLRVYGGKLIIDSSTISGNRAGSGGGIYGSATLSNSTVRENIGLNGGGINGNAVLRNSIVAGNVAWWAPDCSGTMTSLGYNLIGDTTNCTFTLGAGDLANVDAKLGSLAGSPGYHPLAFDSPAVDAGNPTGCIGSTGPLLTDQRGATRVGVCDMGAYEYASPGAAASIEVISGTLQHAPPLYKFKHPLAAVVLDGIGSPLPNATVTFTAPGSGASGAFADSGTHTTTTTTDEYGIAISPVFTANAIEGSYAVESTVAGVVDPAQFQLGNLAWYVTPGGDDASDCQSPGSSCASVDGPLSKNGFYEGDTVFVGIGTYTGTGDFVVTINKDVTLSGGWEGSFSSQNGTSTIDGEQARRGIEVKENVTATVEHFTVKNGFTASQVGGGILNRGDLTFADSTITGNLAGSAGGGIYNKSGVLPGLLTIKSSTVSFNDSSTGAGIYNASRGFLHLNNTTVSSNVGSSSYGGIYNNEGTISLNNSTITNNEGLGLYNRGTVTLRNTILAGNEAECSGNGTYISSGYNLLGDISGCNITPTASDLFDINPFLSPLDDHGGPTLTHALYPDSPAIDAGNPAGCTDDLANPLPVDQRGFTRVDQCDIGAVELQELETSFKTSSVSASPPDTPVAYYITLRNTSDDDLSDVNVTDSVPPSLTYISGSLSTTAGECNYDSGVITCAVAVSAGGSVIVTYRAMINQTVPLGTSIVNSAVISGGGEEFTRTANIMVGGQVCSFTKHASNPVLSAGAAGSWDDEGVWGPAVLLNGGTYMMWYAGYDGSGPSQIGLATSSDGRNWTKDAANPVMSPSVSWEIEGVSSPSVIYEGGLYEMWYTGFDSSGVGRIGYATSSDGITWTKNGNNPVLEIGASGSWESEVVSDPTVIKEESTYHIWYTGFDGITARIGHATSGDGVNWVKDIANPVVDGGAVGGWDWLSVYGACAINVGGEYELWYSGETLPPAWQTGYVVSADGDDWTRVGMVIPEGPSGAFDANSADNTSALVRDSEIHVWYSGLSELGSHSIGFATAEICSKGAITIYLPAIFKNANACPAYYVDDFSDPGSGWLVDDDDDRRFAYTDGEYQIWLKKPSEGWMVTPGAKATDFTVAVSARRTSGSFGAYGLVFGLNEDWTEFYEVIIDSDYYSIWKYDNGEWYFIRNWTYSSHINTGTAWNRIKVIREGARITLHVNGHYLTWHVNDSFIGFRRIGLVAYSPIGDPLDARFDDFSIYPSSCGDLAAAPGREDAGFELGEPGAHEVPLPPELE